MPSAPKVWPADQWDGLFDDPRRSLPDQMPEDRKGYGDRGKNSGDRWKNWNRDDCWGNSSWEPKKGGSRQYPVYPGSYDSGKSCPWDHVLSHSVHHDPPPPHAVPAQADLPRLYKEPDDAYAARVAAASSSGGAPASQAVTQGHRSRNASGWLDKDESSSDESNSLVVPPDVLDAHLSGFVGGKGAQMVAQEQAAAAMVAQEQAAAASVADSTESTTPVALCPDDPHVKTYLTKLQSKTPALQDPRYQFAANWYLGSCKLGVLDCNLVK